MLDFLEGVFTAILTVLALYFLSPYIILLLKTILSKFGSIAFMLVFMIFLNLAGSLIAFVMFHLYFSIILAISPFVTEFTANTIAQGFTGLFIFVVGSLIYKMFKS